LLRFGLMWFAIQISTSPIDIAALLSTAASPCAFMIRNVRPVLLEAEAESLQRSFDLVGLCLLAGHQVIA
jgi:hypothetical protein